MRPTGVIDEELCAGCKVCNLLCPYNAISFDEEKKASRISEALTRDAVSALLPTPALRMLTSALAHYHLVLSQ